MEATNVMHVNYMMDFLNKNYFKESVHNIIAIADGRPDWSVKGTLNFMSLGFFLAQLQIRHPCDPMLCT